MSHWAKDKLLHGSSEADGFDGMSVRVQTSRVVLSLLAGTFVAALSAAAACAQDTPRKPQPTNPFEVISNGLKLRADPVDPADFVKNSRPGEDKLQYIPTGGPRPQPDSKVMSADQIRAKEAELDAMLARHGRAGGRRAPNQVYRSAAGEPKASTATDRAR